MCLCFESRGNQEFRGQPVQLKAQASSSPRNRPDFKALIEKDALLSPLASACAHIWIFHTCIHTQTHTNTFTLIHCICSYIPHSHVHTHTYTHVHIYAHVSYTNTTYWHEPKRTRKKSGQKRQGVKW